MKYHLVTINILYGIILFFFHIALYSDLIWWKKNYNPAREGPMGCVAFRDQVGECNTITNGSIETKHPEMAEADRQ
jgi:hypothetical protein